MAVSRRTFLAAAGASALGLPRLARAQEAALPAYTGPNVILIRFGGGVRRQETIAPETTYSPYFLHELVPRGVLFPRMGIDQFQDINTSHGEGTLYILTGKYQKYHDVENQFLGGRFESPVPTLFEYFRAAYDVPEHEALIVNGEDRTNEEFYNFSNHHLFGVQYRSATLSLFRYKEHLLRRQLAEGGLDEQARLEKEKLLHQMEGLDYRVAKEHRQPEAIERFWDGWRDYYGESGLKNARGDALLTQIAVRAMEELRPRLMMINYNDPDYVHWGNPAHYYNGISVIDRGMRQIVEAAERLEAYRENTIFVIVPDCGRDSNRAQAVPFQHHFNSRSAHEIFALIFGTGIEAGRVVDREANQISVAATVAGLMSFRAEFAEAAPLDEVFA
ncbi:MAG: hypothetical protein GC168_02520 [Candidatus Hydrogenedens sp.]|nr:hypothetical protein [Candidatus Hydrogenedens sp.]